MRKHFHTELKKILTLTSKIRKVQKRWLLDYKLIQMSFISGIPSKYSSYKDEGVS